MKEALYLEISRKADNLEISLSEGEQTLTHYEECRVPALDLQRRSSELLHLLNVVSRRGKIPEKIFHELQQMGLVLYNEIFPLSIKRELAETSAEDIILKIDNRLVQVPWELIYTGKEFLCERFNIGRMVKTQQIIASGIKKELRAPFKMLIVADPRGDLPSAYEEGKQIRERLRQDDVNITVVSSEVSVDYLKKKLLQFDLIHYAGHADYDLEDPSSSGWILEDGKFTALDIRKLSGVNPMPALVFSNACQSGTTEEWQKTTGEWQEGASEGEKIYGLANAFLLAGVQHYVGTFWKVLDKPSTSFAIEFYRNLFIGQSIGQAMKSARIALKGQYGQENILWASYLLYGDPTVRYFAPDAVEVKSLRPRPSALSPAFTTPAPAWNPEKEWLIQEKSRGGLLWKTRPPSELMERSRQAEEECRENRRTPSGQRADKPGKSRFWYTAAALGILAVAGTFFSFLNRPLPLSRSDISIGEMAAVKASDQFLNIKGMNIKGMDDTSLTEIFHGLLKKYQGGEKGPADTWTSRPLTIFFSTGQETPETAILINKIIPRLQEDPRITILERESLEVIVQELALSSSDLADSDSALQQGKLLSGVLFSTCRLYRVDSKLQVTMRIVENETTVVKSAFCEDWPDEASVDSIAERLNQNIIQALDKNFPLRGKIKTVVDYDKVKLNIGARHGLKQGTKLTIIKDQQIYKNGEVIGEESAKVGEVEVSEVKTGYSYAKVLGRSEDLAAGMKVIP